MKLADLQDEIDQTQVRVTHEQAELRQLARYLYGQPASPILALFSAGSPSEALNHYADLRAAAERAAATRSARDRDLSRLQNERTTLEEDRQRADAARSTLANRYQQLLLSLGVSSAIQVLILDTFAAYGPAGQAWALRVADCESHYNPNAVNSASGASGLFQFLPSSWASTPQGRQGLSVFDPAANAQGAAWYYGATGRTGGPWSCK
ncbi:MAG: transglycosylase SLT domain-containing protein [Candidatus Dormibacteraeota bacterium]|uniref:Transglycosylase SLT domain-containing protein n=1 Tax=Candidatus Dormiibacter inghamiae TaxID=3127013 RepID=A0A934KG25_9BACT|nr:transglycosylase SLT domain-containing protein [Candidatus Dormibacteraeota bacterium]MBJ7607568.1 transglycosylase SLT domain-containing protein [Candidatus Dormibacteraeota bacterium]